MHPDTAVGYGHLGMEVCSDGLNRTRAVEDLIKDIEASTREAMRKKEPDQPQEDIKHDIKAMSKAYIYF